jgi:hypothetical protein
MIVLPVCLGMWMRTKNIEIGRRHLVVNCVDAGVNDYVSSLFSRRRMATTQLGDHMADHGCLRNTQSPISEGNEIASFSNRWFNKMFLLFAESINTGIIIVSKRKERAAIVYCSVLRLECIIQLIMDRLHWPMSMDIVAAYDFIFLRSFLHMKYVVST